ncbi:hypothetical protein GCM10020367_06750 [Streptomyces sannanensis]|uniref:Uncharacterized protein n=1 Tax=Streptomyces sannanensis TaxID=285536 RepID=A0ABP6S5C7_9ACTN
MTGLTASLSGWGYQPAVIHGSLNVNETTNCLWPGGKPVNTSQTPGADARTPPGAHRRTDDALGSRNSGPAPAVRVLAMNVCRFDASEETARRVLHGLRQL